MLLRHAPACIMWWAVLVRFVLLFKIVFWHFMAGSRLSVPGNTHSPPLLLILPLRLLYGLYTENETLTRSSLAGHFSHFTCSRLLSNKVHYETRRRKRHVRFMFNIGRLQRVGNSAIKTKRREREKKNFIPGQMT